MARSDPKELVGRTLGGVYRIQRHVASGGFADVYQAWHEQLKTSVAVKVRRVVDGKPDEAMRNDDYAYAHFEQEAILGFRLRNPHVVRVLDFRCEARVEYLVMEWLDGQSLRDIADGRPMYWRRAAELLAQAAEGVAALHAEGWLHRDIKPDNFMVVGEAERERVVVIDLGLVRHRPLEEPLVSQLAEPTEWIAHTPGYCAPEVFSKAGSRFTESPFSVASDVFALGVTLFKLITGRLPWPGTTPQQQQLEIALGLVATRPSDYGARIPHDLEMLIVRTLEADPARRPSSATALVEELRRLLSSGKPAPAHATARPTPLVRSDVATVRPPARTARPRPVPMSSRTRSAALTQLVLWVGGVVLLALLLNELESPAPDPLALAADTFAVPTPTPSPVVVIQPNIALPATVPPAAAAAEPEMPRPRRLELDRQLRACPDSPRGAVVLEVRGHQLVTIDLEPLVATDPWHTCASRRVARAGVADGQHIMNL